MMLALLKTKLSDAAILTLKNNVLLKIKKFLKINNLTNTLMI